VHFGSDGRAGLPQHGTFLAVDLLKSADRFARRTFRPFSSLWVDTIGGFALLGVPIAVGVGWSWHTALTVALGILVVLVVRAGIEL
jgi:hypothetical protein